MEEKKTPTPETPRDKDAEAKVLKEENQKEAALDQEAVKEKIEEKGPEPQVGSNNQVNYNPSIDSTKATDEIRSKPDQGLGIVPR